MNKTTNKYTPEVRERAVRMVLNGEGQHESRWAAIVSISAKIGYAPQILNELVKKVEVDTDQCDGFTVIPPFLMGLSRRIHAAVFSFMAGVIPPIAMLGRSLLYVQSHFVA